MVRRPSDTVPSRLPIFWSSRFRHVYLYRKSEHRIDISLGKTSLISVLAGLFGLDVYIVSLQDKTLTETPLIRLVSQLASRCIFLLEDVDAAGLVRDEVKETSNCNISLSGLLNAIDGISSPEGRILVMTTNNPEVLDAALVRPWRVDVHIVFGLPTATEIEKLFLSIYGSQEGVGFSIDSREISKRIHPAEQATTRQPGDLDGRGYAEM